MTHQAITQSQVEFEGYMANKGGNEQTKLLKHIGALDFVTNRSQSTIEETVTERSWYPNEMHSDPLTLKSSTREERNGHSIKPQPIRAPSSFSWVNASVKPCATSHSIPIIDQIHTNRPRDAKSGDVQIEMEKGRCRS